MEKKSRRQVIVYRILFVGLIAGITAVLFPYVERLSDPQFQKVIEAWLDKMGIIGFLLVMGIQILQVVIAFIPGEPVEILSGALYGTVGGLFICLFGCMIASTIIFSLSKRYGKPLLFTLFGKEKVQGWKWLQDSENRACNGTDAAAQVRYCSAFKGKQPGGTVLLFKQPHYAKRFLRPLL